MSSDERPKLMSDVASRNYYGKQSKSGSVEEFCKRLSGLKATSFLPGPNDQDMLYYATERKQNLNFPLR